MSISDLPRTAAATCQRRFASAAASGARQLRVFGSASKGQDRFGGDRGPSVDLPAGISLLHLVGPKLGLEDALCIEVDLGTERGLDPALRGTDRCRRLPLVNGRERLSHACSKADLKAVRAMIQHDLPQLNADVRRMFGRS